MPVGAIVATVAVGAASASASVYASKQQSKAAKRSGDLQSQATDAALEWEKEQEERRRQEYEEEKAHQYMREDEERRLLEEKVARDEADLQRRILASKPYTDLGAYSATTLQGLLQPTPEGGRPLMVRSGPTAPLPGPMPPGMPSMTPQTAPFSVPDASLQDLARRRPTA